MVGFRWRPPLLEARPTQAQRPALAILVFRRFVYASFSFGGRIERLVRLVREDHTASRTADRESAGEVPVRIAFYHPNMHLFGGGEMVALTLASALREKHEVTIFVAYPVDRRKLERFFALPLDGIIFRVFGRVLAHVPVRFLRPSLYVKRALALFRGFDVVIDTASNGMFCRPLPQKTICYVHFPAVTGKMSGVRSLLNPLLVDPSSMFCYDRIVCNSEFTRSHVARLTREPLRVVYPPVKCNEIRVLPKEDLVISIGRFSPEKKHEVMIDAFKKVEQRSSLRLLLIGARSDPSYLRAMRSRAAGHRIMFAQDLPHPEVLQLLGRARYYWHARGYGETDPITYENFGISTVEALAAGCIPIVIDKGAQPEIVNDPRYVWATPEELIERTLSLRGPPRIDLSPYEQDRFIKAFTSILEE